MIRPSNLYLRLLLFSFFLFFFSGPSLIAVPRSIKWLKLDGGIQKNWDVSYTGENNSIMFIMPKWGNDDLKVKKIYSIVPKKSSSYVLAVNKLLEVLYQERVQAQLIIQDFERDEKKGIRFLQEAEQKQVDLIFTLGSESAALVHKYFKGKAIPVVTSTNKDPVALGLMENYTDGSGNNIATTSLNVPIKIQLNYLFQLVPDLKNIGLIYNRNHKQVMATEVIPAKKEFHKQGLKVFDIAVESHKTAKETLALTLPQVVEAMRKSDPGLKKSIFWLTASTAAFSQIKTINQHAAQIPVITSVPHVVKKGDDSAVLAIGIDRRNNAHLASLYAVKILRGEAQAGDLKVGVVTPPDIAISFKIARKIGLKIPFDFFESAAFIYDYQGNTVRSFGESLLKK